MDEIVSDPDARNAVLECNTHNVEPIPGSRACDVTASALCMFAITVCFTRFYWMSGMTIARSHAHRLVVFLPDFIKHIHKLRLHIV